MSLKIEHGLEKSQVCFWLTSKKGLETNKIKIQVTKKYYLSASMKRVK